MVTATIEGGRSVGARVISRGGVEQAEGGATGFPHPVRDGSQLAQGVDSPVREGTEGLMGGSDDWVAGVAGDWRGTWRAVQNLTKNKVVSSVFWRDGGRGRLGGITEFGT